MRGRTLGPYEIVDLLGRGGMGEVYRARDTRLGRDVALKVLPAELARDPDLQERLRREARTVSSLNHPHICVLHDVGHEGDVHFLVMELVDGVTLAQKLQGGPLPLADLVRYGTQIADALDRAHKAGIVHRDLKPGNVMVTRTGAKLMDFGLARTATSATQGDATVAMTDAPLTAEGAIVGTFQYMAPEQLEGREADPRADVWALGCVLYEMATGRRAFEGATQASVIGAILHARPEPVSNVVPLSPPALERLIDACLAKDPDDRVQSAHDVKLQLQWLEESEAVPAATASRSRPWAWVAALVLTAIAASVGTAVLRPQPTSDVADVVYRYDIGRFDLRPRVAPVISPDDSYLVFNVLEDGESWLYRRDFDDVRMRRIEGTQGAFTPFFSPDGRWIAFATDTALMKIPAEGGVAQLVTRMADITSGDWAPDGTIYFTPQSGGIDGDIALYRVSSAGGTAEVFARLDVAGGESAAWLPTVLPDGETVLVTTVGGTWSPSGLTAFAPDGSRTPVTSSAFMGRYVDGHLFYRDADSGVVLAVPFDPSTLRTNGAALPLTEQVSASHCFDVSTAGDLVYVLAASAEGGGRLAWSDRDGQTQVMADRATSWQEARIAPDGRQVVVRLSGANCELWLFDLERRAFTRLAGTDDDHHDPVWAPDGDSVVYRRGVARQIVRTTVDLPYRTTVLDWIPGAATPSSWVGDRIAVSLRSPGTGDDVWFYPADAAGEGRAVVATGAQETAPALSPDGRWLAYVSDASGVKEVYVQRLADAATWGVSAGGGDFPVWAPDGSELYYRRGSTVVACAVAVEGDLLVLSPPEDLADMSESIGTRDYDPAPDGRFVVVDFAGGSGHGQLVRALVGWQEMVRRLGE